MDSDDEKQNGANFHKNQPYDESLEVPDAEDVASVYTPSPSVQRGVEVEHRSRGETPPDSRMSEEQSDDEFETGPPAGDHGAALLQQQQQAMQGMHHQMHDDDDDDEDVEGEDDDEDDSDPIQQMQHQGRPPGIQHEKSMYGGPSGSGGSGDQQGDDEETDDEDDDDDDDDDDDEGGAPMEGAYDPAEYEHLAVTPEIKELFQYITRYTPQTIDLDHKLKPFIPDYIPAVGDIDAFIKIPRPDGKPDTLGLTVLDEPCAKQSDPTVLDLQLRAISKQPTVKSVAVKSIEDADKNPKAIESWINSITELHRVKPAHNVHYTKNMPDVDNLMEEWPADFEELLKEVGLPTADIDCDLATYVDMICAILDIPVYKSRIQSLHLLFTLFSEFKNSQHFRGLADANKLDNALKLGEGAANEESDRLIL